MSLGGRVEGGRREGEGWSQGAEESEADPLLRGESRAAFPLGDPEWPFQGCFLGTSCHPDSIVKLCKEAHVFS